MSEELANCPFCGGRPHVGAGVTVYCFDCGAEGPGFTDDQEENFRLWNIRVPATKEG